MELLTLSGMSGNFQICRSSLELPSGLLVWVGQLSQISPSIWGQQGTQTVILPSSPHPLNSTNSQPHPSARDLIRLLPSQSPKEGDFD